MLKSKINFKYLFLVSFIFFQLFLTLINNNNRNNLYSAFELFSPNPEFLAIGNISTFDNPTRTSPIMLSASNNFMRLNYILPYGITELSKESLEMQIDITGKREDFLFVSFETFGTDYEIYGEHSLLIANNLFQTDIFQFSPSIALNILQLEEEFYYSGSVNLSIYLKLFEKKVELISSLNNLYANEISFDDDSNNYEEKVSTLFVNLDIKYNFMTNLAFFIGLEKDDKYELIVKNGIKYTIAPYIDLMAGYNFEPSLLTSGFTINLFKRKLKFSNAFSYHKYLDFSFSSGLTYVF